MDNTASFAFPAPHAVGIDLETGSESNTNHTAYLAGMSAWCANCHTSYRDGHSATFIHPTDINLSDEIVRQYNIYNGTADSAGGNFATAYLSTVPFENQSNSISAATGPTTSSRIMCLTCHRAHATSAPHALRWDPNVTLLSRDGVVSGSYPIPDPYNSPSQTGLCYKCHITGDEFPASQQ
jgi:predicted CXXCH cytochrome family protein